MAKRQSAHHQNAPGVTNPGANTLRDLGVAAILLAGTFLLYLPALKTGFINYDDDRYVTANPIVQRGLTAEGVKWAFTTTHFANWLPVTWLSHMLDCQLYGLAPAGHHATSALLHALNAGLVFLALHALTRSRGRSLAVALLFAAHPLRVESAVWIAERKDVLCGTFFLLTLLAYDRYARRPSGARYASVLAPYALGLMSKTMIVTMPCVLLLLDVWPLGRLQLRSSGTPAAGAANSVARVPPRSLGALLLEKLPMLLLAGTAASWTMVFQEEGGALTANAELSLAQRLANAVVSVPRYLGKVLWPADLAVFYPHPGTWPAWRVAASAAVIVAVTASAWLLRRRQPAALVGWLWFLGMLVPVSGVIQAGLQSMADRYTYLPGIGLALAVVWLVADALRGLILGNTVSAGAMIVAALTIACAVVTVRQEGYWLNTFTVMSRAAEVTQDNWLAHGHVGSELAARGDPAAAQYHFEQALRINPRHADAWVNWGNVLLRTGRPAEAIPKYREGITLRPRYPEAHNNLGTALAMIGHFAGAETEFAAAAAQRPDWSDALGNWAAALARLGRTEEAIAKYREALAADPTNDRARRGLAQLGGARVGG